MDSLEQYILLAGLRSNYWQSSQAVWLEKRSCIEDTLSMLRECMFSRRCVRRGVDGWVFVVLVRIDCK